MNEDAGLTIKITQQSAEITTTGVVCMKKIGDIMTEMGFNKNAPDSVKEAFIKHLIKASTGVTLETPSEKKKKIHTAETPIQLAFSLEDAVVSEKKAV